MGLLDFAAVNDERIALAPLVAEDRLAVEGEVECGGKVRMRVGEEADLRLGGWVQGRGPGFHAGRLWVR